METYFGIIVFDNHDDAKALHHTLKDLHKKELIVLQDAVFIDKDEKGKVHVKETEDTTTGKGAAKGGTLGFILGVFFGGPIGGLLLGAAAGAFVGKKIDHGIPKDQIKAVVDELGAGMTALCLEAQPVKEGALRTAVQASNGKVYEVNVAEQVLVEVHDTLHSGKANWNTI